MVGIVRKKTTFFLSLIASLLRGLGSVARTASQSRQVALNQRGVLAMDVLQELELFQDLSQADLQGSP